MFLDCPVGLRRIAVHGQSLTPGLSLQPPFEEPVLIFGLAMIVFFAAPLILERFRLPGIIGIIVVGAAIGPEGFGLLADTAGIELLGEAGLIFLMFLAGLEIDFNQFLEYKDRSLVFGGFSFVIPQVVGTGAGLVILDLSLAPAMLFGAIFSSHTLLAYPIVSKYDIAKNEAMTATIGGTILTDTMALLVLAVVIASLGDAVGWLFWTQFALGLTVFFVGTWLLVPRVGRWFFRHHDEESYYEFLFVIAVLFACAIVAEVVGVKHIIGAFLAGLALNRQIPSSGPLMNRIEFVGNALLIPFFLLWVGTLVDPRALIAGGETLLIAGSLLVMVVLTKLVASWLTGRVYDYSTDEVVGMFGLSVGQAAAALAIVLIGFEEGVPGFDEHMINGVVLMILAVSVLSPTVVGRAGRAILRTEERAEYDPEDQPQRILVPVSPAAEYREELLDLALAIRDDRSDEPVHTASVVRSSDEPDAAEIESIEELLAEMEEYAAGAEVETTEHSIVSDDVAEGITRTTVENRIDTIVIGWDGTRSRTKRIFGHIIDAVLETTRQLTLVGRVREPMNTVDRVVVIFPPLIDHNDGVFEALQAVKRVAERTGSELFGIVVDGDPDQFERLSGMVDPEVTAEFEAVGDWNAVLEILRDDVDDETMVALLSARRGDIGWHRELETLPKSISTLVDGNFVVVFPTKEERKTDDRQFLRFH